MSKAKLETIAIAKVLHDGWEMDTKMWIEGRKDGVGKKYLMTTDCGSPYETNLQELNEKIKETEESLQQLYNLKEIMEGRKRK